MIEGIRIVSSEVNNEGTVFRFTVADNTGKETGISLPANEISSLLSLLHQAAGLIRQIQNNSSIKEVFPLQTWEVGQHPDGDSLVLSFRSNEDFEMSYRMYNASVIHYLEVLATASEGFNHHTPHESSH